jgi:two-component system, NarL family, response regulator NreC
MSKIRVVIADDYAMLRASLRAVLTGDPQVEVVGEAEDRAVLIEQCESLNPEMVLLDLSMRGRGGIAAIRRLKQTRPGLKVLAVSMHDDESYEQRARRSGAAGYVSRWSGASTLLTAIRAVRNGERCFDPAAVTPACQATPPAGLDAAALESLTARQRELLHRVALGYTNAESAESLHVSERTVERHRKKIMAKLGLRKRRELVSFALAHDMLRK